MVAIYLRQPLRAMLPTPELNFQRTPVTLILTALAAALEVVCTVDPERRMYYLDDLRLGLWWEVWSGEYWRPITCTLLHGNLLHAAFNIYWLLILGGTAEVWLGSWWYLGLFVVLADSSSMAQFAWTNYDELRSGLVGLSGVVYGMFGLLWAAAQRRSEFRWVVDPQVVQTMMVWFFACILMTNAGIMRVANIAHGAGLVVGGLIGFALTDRERRPLWIAAAALLAGVGLVSTAYCPGHVGYEYARAWAAAHR